VGDALPLVALRASATATITCRDVHLADRFRLKGPSPRVLAGRKRSLPIGQTFLAMGLGRAALDLLAAHDSPAALIALERLGARFDALRDEIIKLSQPGREADATDAAPRIRGACNDLVLRLTHAAVALYKGRSLLLDHPAQRLAREALFLLVWSCPNPVIDCTVDLLSSD
jgi:alkylation response protein AidB-like acyl-CoA dehydrogenase